MTSRRAPAKPVDPAQEAAERKALAETWRPVPGKPHLEENGLGQWRTKGHDSGGEWMKRYNR